MKLALKGVMFMSKSGLILFTKALEMILYVTLHSAMGRNWLTNRVIHLGNQDKEGLVKIFNQMWILAYYQDKSENILVEFIPKFFVKKS